MSDAASTTCCPSKKEGGKGLLKRLRVAFLVKRHGFIEVGPGFYLGYRSRIRRNSVRVGGYSFVGNSCHLASALSIGNWCMLASNVSVVGGDHRFDRVGCPSAWAGRGENKEVVIEDDVWVGHGAIIMHGIRIGEGAVVASGAVVTHDIAAYTVVGGVPAKEIRRRFGTVKEEERHKDSLATLRSQYGLFAVSEPGSQ